MTELFAGKEFAEAAAKETNWAQINSMDVGGMKQVIEYGQDTALFRATVTLKDNYEVALIQSAHEPIFGLDIEDSAVINDLSEKMAMKLEAA